MGSASRGVLPPSEVPDGVPVAGLKSVGRIFGPKGTKGQEAVQGPVPAEDRRQWQQTAVVSYAPKHARGNKFPKITTQMDKKRNPNL